MLKCEHCIGPNLPDLPSQRPQEPQEGQGIARPARRTIECVGRLFEGFRLAEEKQIADLITERGQAGADKPGNLLSACVLCLSLNEKNSARRFHLTLQCLAR